MAARTNSTIITVKDLMATLAELPPDFEIHIAALENDKWDTRARDIIIERSNKKVVLDNWPTFDF